MESALLFTSKTDTFISVTVFLFVFFLSDVICVYLFYYIQNEGKTITLIYKDIISLFYHESYEMVAWRESRDRQRSTKIYTKLRYDIFREPYFFALLPRGGYRSIHYRSRREALLFSSGIIHAFEISESCIFRLFSTTRPGTIFPFHQGQCLKLHNVKCVPCSTL